MPHVRTKCCIVGGGPAGMMLGFLLARAGIPVAVLEKHPDFLRDFRGDTVHPSTLEMIYELGLLDKFLKLPHSVVRQISLQIGGDRVVVGHFEHLPVHCKFIALMPQWDFLNFLASEGKRCEAFDLRMRTEALDVIQENGRIVGVRAKGPDGEFDIYADLTVGCDGRHSVIREKAGLVSDDYGAPMDVLWFRLSHRQSDPDETFGHIKGGRMMVMLNRGDYWQCAYVIPKGSADEIRSSGIEKFRRTIGEMSPFTRDRLDEIENWDKVKLLTVTVDRLRRWYRAGLLCIGDAAHAMSPVGGVGINLAVQDAVAGANILAAPLTRGDVTPETLDQVQRRREFPTRVTQRIQIIVQNKIIGPALKNQSTKAPLFMKIMQWPLLRRIPGRLLALGVRPEHIRTPQAASTR